MRFWPLPPKGGSGVKIACPRCGSTRIKDAVEGAPKPLNCHRGHAFSYDEGLIPFGEAVRLAQAIDSPKRLRILLEFGRRAEMSATEVGRRVGLDVGTARYHLVKLVEHDPPLLSLGRKVPKQGSTEQKYELNRTAFAS